MTHPAIVAAARSVFEASGAEAIDPAYVLPADIPLELSGEAVRARLCVFTDHRGNEMAMRPDLTLPVGGVEAARRCAGGDGEKAYTYAAQAFRLAAAANDPTEFTQVGVERFGAASSPEADADVFALVQAAVSACEIEPSAIVMGDLAVFPAFVNALDIAGVTADLLKRAFRQEGGVAELLASPPQHLDDDLSDVLGDPDPVAAFLKLLKVRGVPMIGTRSVDEIVGGLGEKQSAALVGGVPDAAGAVLRGLFAIDCEAAAAPEHLSALAKTHGLSGVDGAIERLATRISKIDAPGARFRSGFGRRFTYYDGFVFEVFADGLTNHQPVASGGRYDGLIRDLSGGGVQPMALAAWCVLIAYCDPKEQAHEPIHTGDTVQRATEREDRKLAD